MKTSIHTFLFIVLNIHIFFNYSFSTHIDAGEIEFEQIGDREVQARVILYHFRSKLENAEDSVTICWGDGNCQQILRINGEDIDNNGVPNGEFVSENVVKNIYQGTHKYDEVGSYSLSYTGVNRTGGSLNVNHPNSEQVKFYVETSFQLLEDDFDNNHSPQLLEPPIDIALERRLFRHTPNAFDLDGDSIAYELIVPMQGKQQAVPAYQFPNQINPGPDNNLSIHPETGEVVWDNPQRGGYFVIAIHIKTYRNGALMEEMVRDMIIEVEQMDELNPNLSIDTTLVEVIDVAIGDLVQVEAQTTKSDFFDSLYLTSSSGLYRYFNTPATFETTLEQDNITGTFNWLVEQEDFRQQPYQIVFKARNFENPFGWSSLGIVRFKVKESIINDVDDNYWEELGISIGPNPSREKLTIYANKPLEDWNYQLIGANGQLLRNGRLQNSNEEIDIQDLASGIHYLRLWSGKKQMIKVWVKQ